MMKVRITREWFTHKPGDVVELADGRALQLIADGFAEKTGGPKTATRRKVRETAESVKG